MTTDTGTTTTHGTGRYAPVNGLEMYYEIHGTGSPLILIPGGLMTIDMMGALLPSLAKTRQVIAVEPQGHGHTADIDRPLTYEHMADDIAALISYLGIERADVFGFSMGGGIALQTAIRHPGECASWWSPRPLSGVMESIPRFARWRRRFMRMPLCCLRIATPISVRHPAPRTGRSWSPR